MMIGITISATPGIIKRRSKEEEEDLFEVVSY
jgi:hypothetical protein